MLLYLDNSAMVIGSRFAAFLGFLEPLVLGMVSSEVLASLRVCGERNTVGRADIVVV